MDGLDSTALHHSPAALLHRFKKRSLLPPVEPSAPAFEYKQACASPTSSNGDFECVRFYLIEAALIISLGSAVGYAQES